MKISLIINCDTRLENAQQDGLFSGTVNMDFLTEGVRNKQLFFSGFDIETILYVDLHTDIPEEELVFIRKSVDCLIIRKHTNENCFNDWNYWRAFSMASGDIICHCDQDTAAFTSGKEYIDELIGYLDNYSFCAYPSYWTPKAIDDSSFGHRTWASTRFFLCKKESLKLDELANCIREPEWGYSKYGDSPRRVNWTEHYLTLINNDSCIYPPIELQKGAIFSWASYSKWTLRRLNDFPYSKIVDWISSRGGIHYPVDVNCD